MHHANQKWFEPNLQGVFVIMFGNRIRRMRMKVRMTTYFMSVKMQMHSRSFDRSPHRSHSQQHEHDRNSTLGQRNKTFRDLQSEREHDAAAHQQRRGMTGAPKRSDHRRSRNAFVAAHNGGDSDEMIRIQGVTNAKHEAECEDGPTRTVE